jgi:pimeloyl-ACP methyl ester carboxylesterase
LGEIRVPTLVLVGDDDACTPVHLSRELAEAIPGARLEILPGGHLIYQEAPAEFLARIVEFVGSR